MMKRGFTLVEIMISILVMTIAFFAVLAVQGSAIGAYNAGRDSTESSELARAVIEYMNIEAQQWTTGSITSPTNSYSPTNKPFDKMPVLLTLAAGNLATWVPLVDTPVDVRLARDPTLTGEKFCVFARGAYVEADTTDLNLFEDATDTSLLTGSPLFRVQIATLYPGPRAIMPAGSCAAFDLTLLDPEDIEPLEMQGFRVAYFGTMIVRRDFSR
jgi:prepilin-type N-terminal cleavage/methylation domain-containing protein